MSLDNAAKKVIHERLAALGGQGGLIALDKQGNYSFQFNTEGMFRGVMSTNQEAATFIYK
jgi:beta-aspartyl-peptidase (threonine type)